MPREIKDIKKLVLEDIESGKVRMRPKIYFVAGSVLTLMGISSAIIVAIFSLSIASMWLRVEAGLGGRGRLLALLSNFPWWTVVSALVGITVGVVLLRKYDFSYQKNFKKIAIALLMAIILSGLLADITGLSDILVRRGPLRDVMRSHMQENISPPLQLPHQ